MESVVALFALLETREYPVLRCVAFEVRLQQLRELDQLSDVQVPQLSTPVTSVKLHSRSVEVSFAQLETRN